MEGWRKAADIVGMTKNIARPHGDDAGRSSSPLLAPAILCYLVLALALAGALALLAPPDVLLSSLLLAGGLAALAVALERPLDRTARPTRTAAPAAYVAAVLLLPAPWPLYVAAFAAAVWGLLRFGAPVLGRVTYAAHTLAVTALFMLLAHVVAGDMRLLRGLAGLLSGHAAPINGMSDAPVIVPGHSAMSLSHVGVLTLLAVAYYLLDIVPFASLHGAMRRTTLAEGWQHLYRRIVLVDVAVPTLGVLAAVLYATAPPLALLALPALLGLDRALGLSASDHPALAPSEPPGPGVLMERYEADARLRAVLAVVRALGSTDDLATITGSLADAASRLTRFRACTVYLYDAHEGVFVPMAGGDETALSRHDEPIPRDAAERLMSHRNLVGYSYYAPLEQMRGLVRAEWHTGDVLLVPLLLKNGDVMGFISLDRPADGRVPNADDLVPVETVAALGAGVIARLRHTDEALRLAATDGLTGLLNRRALEERLAAEVAASAYRRPVALMMIDLDDFGSINNVHGHQAGDEALRIVSSVIRAHLRQNDAGGRYGGDEFVVILPGLDSIAALDVAERVRAALVEATARAADEGRLPRVHTSIGVASYPDDAASMQALIKAADDALYSSKRLGKNRVSLKPVA